MLINPCASLSASPRSLRRQRRIKASPPPSPVPALSSKQRAPRHHHQTSDEHTHTHTHELTSQQHPAHDQPRLLRHGSEPPIILHDPIRRRPLRRPVAELRRRRAAGPRAAAAAATVRGAEDDLPRAGAPSHCRRPAPRRLRVHHAAAGGLPASTAADSGVLPAVRDGAVPRLRVLRRRRGGLLITSDDRIGRRGEGSGRGDKRGAGAEEAEEEEEQVPRRAAAAVGEVGGGDPRPAPRRAQVAGHVRHRRGGRQGVRPGRHRVPRPARQAQLPVPRAAGDGHGPRRGQRGRHHQVVGQHAVAVAVALQRRAGAGAGAAGVAAERRARRAGNRGAALGRPAGLDEAGRRRALVPANLERLELKRPRSNPSRSTSLKRNILAFRYAFFL